MISTYEFRIVFLLFIFFSIQYLSFGQKLDDQTLFNKINLDYPGLEEVKDAVRKRDYSAAKKAYVAFQRKRSNPHHFYSRDLSSKYPSTSTTSNIDVNKALENAFRARGHEYKFPGKINWHFNPTDKNQNPSYSGTYLSDWTFMFNRLYFTRQLGNAFARTGNPLYARKMDELLLDWIQNAPIRPTEWGDAHYWTSPWRTLEAGLRMGENWPEAWMSTIRSPELREGTVIAWIKSWIEHSEYLMDYQGSLNWLTAESVGLYNAGVLFPELKSAKRWRETAISRLNNQIYTDFYPDGTQTELAPSYHRGVTEISLDVYRLAQLNNYSISQTFIDNIEKSYEYLLKISLPNRFIPRLNDSGEDDLVKIFERKMRDGIFPHRKDFEWMRTDGRKGSPPSFKSVLVPWAGQAIMRENWDSDANYLIMEYGPYGDGAHQHEDKLGIHIAGYGDLFVFEAGAENYGTSTARKFCESSQGHSVVTIDNKSQYRKFTKEAYVTDAPFPVDWEVNENFDYVSSTYGGDPTEKYGIGSSKVDLGTWRRHAIYVKPDVFLIMDVMIPKDNQVHSYQSRFHLNATYASIDKNNQRVTVSEGNRPPFTITPLIDGGVKGQIAKGQRSPELMGWEFWINKGDRAIPTVTYSKSGQGITTFAYVFKANPKGSTIPKPTISRLNTTNEEFGVEVKGDIGNIDPFKAVVATREGVNKVRWNGKEYPSSRIIIFGSGATTRIYDLKTGKLLEGKEPPKEEEDNQDEEDNSDDGNENPNEENPEDSGPSDDFSCSSFANLCTSGRATQSSQKSATGGADKAIDGKIWNSSTLSTHEQEPWWEIALEKESYINEVKIWNRLNCCKDEEDKCYILISSRPFASDDLWETINDANVTAINFKMPTGEEVISNINTNGQFVRIQVAGQEYLSLREVEVMGCSEGSGEDNPDKVDDEEDNGPAGSTPGEIWLEAECGDIGGAWEVVSNEQTSNKEYILVPNQKLVFSSEPNTDPQYIASYTFQADQAGSYKMFFLARGGNLGDDSFWVRMNGGNWVKFNFIKGELGFEWTQVHDTDNNNKLVNFNLVAGNNTLEVALREDGTMLDKVFLTNQNKNPSNLGDTAYNCGNEPDDNTDPDPDPDPEEDPVSAFETHWIEAECGELGTKWRYKFDDIASNGKYAYPAYNKSFYGSPPQDEILYARYFFETQNAGKFKIHLRTMSKNKANDSFWVRVNSNRWIKYNGIPLSTNDFIWSPVKDSDKDLSVVTFDLPKGTNELFLALRENHTYIDKICITNNDDEIPESMGEYAVGCEPIITELAKEEVFEEISVDIFPNPVNEVLQVDIQIHPDSPKNDSDGFVEVYDNLGRVIYEEDVHTFIDKRVVYTDSWEDGIYYLVVQLGDFRRSYKLVKHD